MINTNGNLNNSQRPFPALTPAQRYHLDVYGYVVIENTLTADETGRLREALQKLKHDFLASSDPANATVRNCRMSVYKPHHVHFAHVLESDPAILDYLTHPRLVGDGRRIGRWFGAPGRVRGDYQFACARL